MSDDDIANVFIDRNRKKIIIIKEGQFRPYFFLVKIYVSLIEIEQKTGQPNVFAKQNL